MKQPVLLLKHLLIYFLTPQVFKPTMAYNGQNEIRLVKTKTPASTSNTVANVPVIIPVYARIAMITAITILTALSVFPMFGFMIFY